MIEIVNMNILGQDCPGHRIDRRTVIGNPYWMDEELEALDATAERNRVCDLYHRWLWNKIKEKGQVYRLVNEFADEYIANQSLILKCWCAPKRCHAESIRAAVLWVVKNR